MAGGIDDGVPATAHKGVEIAVAVADEMVALTHELGIADRVDWLGFVDDVPDQLSRLDILVHASITPEPFGQVVIEGFAAGTVVVAADGGGPREIVRPETDGLLCPAGDVDAYAAALSRLRSDPALRQRLTSAARERVCEFSPETVSGLVMGVYEHTLARRATRARLAGIRRWFGRPLPARRNAG